MRQASSAHIGLRPTSQMLQPAGRIFDTPDLELALLAMLHPRSGCRQAETVLP